MLYCILFIIITVSIVWFIIYNCCMVCFLYWPWVGGCPRSSAKHTIIDLLHDPCFITANFPTNIMDFRGFDSSITSIVRGGIFMSINNFPKSSSQAILVGIMLVGRLGVQGCFRYCMFAVAISRFSCFSYLHSMAAGGGGPRSSARSARSARAPPWCWRPPPAAAIVLA